ncbi:MAG: NAD-dependent epimerase/dehydratase family protein [Deltaproteobacteria bacterium]|nr:NAD-dependent epimerase/dehydratase family protein [Deltaproteobacteria bacterium]
MARTKASPKARKSTPKTQYPTIALTGSGFKGQALLHWLENSPIFPKVIFLDYKKPKTQLKKTKYYRVDLTENLADVKLYDILAEEKVDTLIHTALPITPPRNVAWAHELLSVGSMYVCNAAAEAKVRKMILASTADVYGAFPDNPAYITENQPPRGGLKSRFIADKIDAEKQFLKYAQKYPQSTVTILRPATILGPTIQSYKTLYLSRLLVPTVLGFDPLVQFLHEVDLLRAFQAVILKDYPGIFNIASKGILPLSRAIKLLGKIDVPLSLMGLKSLVQLLWFLDISPAPATHLEYLKYSCVVATDRAEKVMGFVPRYSCNETLLEFVGAERLREVRLQEEASLS